MEADQGKLFIGGISWDTNEDRLKEYFGSYGEIVEAVIMRDRTTGRARGFGFVVFSDPEVAERVVQEKHVIDGRTVEAKKAVPRDDQNLIIRNSGSVQSSPGLGRTKKIFVGGLASTVTENDFKTYFEQFGTITDVVVMYDHNTQRPRGFGFITYDAEEAVDRVLLKTFHELNGKMVEVKRAVPKEMSPVPTRGGSVVGYNNYGIGRVNNILSSYTPAYNLGSIGGYGVRLDSRYSPLASAAARSGFSQFGSPSYGMGVNMDQGLNGSFGGSSNLGYGRVLNPYFNGSNQSRYSTPIGYNGGSGGRGDSLFNTSPRNVWGNSNGGLNTSPRNANSASYFGLFGNNGGNWGTSSPIGASIGGSLGGYNGGNVGYRGGENSYAVGAGAGGFGRNSGATGLVNNTSMTGGYEANYGDFYRSGSVYGDPTWQTASSEIDNSSSFGYRLGNSDDVNAKDSEDYGVSYDIPNRQSNRESWT